MRRVICVFFLVQTILFSLNSFSADQSCFSLLDSLNSEKANFAEASASSKNAGDSFENYFAAVRKVLIERDYIVDAAELALLAEEHLLLMGPPGNAKSMMADLILGHIVQDKTPDGKESKKPSYYSIQMTPETTLSETHGPLDYKTLTETNRYERIYAEGMLLSRNVFIDEIFDARANAIRNILGLLAERAHKQGPRVVKGNLETAFAATNRYISEVYEKTNDDGPKALLDRFSFSAFVPGEFEDSESYLKLMEIAKKKDFGLPEFTFEQLEELRSKVGDVQIPRYVGQFLSLLSFKIKNETEALEQSALKTYRDKIRNGEEAFPPYRATKYHSPRTLGKAANILRAIVVRDWVRKGGKRPLTANLSDLAQLESFFTLMGPADSFIQNVLERTSNPHERAQLTAILREREIYRNQYQQIMSSVNQVTYKYALSDVQSSIDHAKTDAEREEIAKKLTKSLVEVGMPVSGKLSQTQVSGETIGMEMVKSFILDALREVLGEEKYKTEIAGLLKQIEAVQQEKLEALKKAEELRKQKEREAARQLEAEEEARQREAQARKAHIKEIIDGYSAEKGSIVTGQAISYQSLLKASHSESGRVMVYSPADKKLTIIKKDKVTLYDTSSAPNDLRALLAETDGPILKVSFVTEDMGLISTTGSIYTFDVNTGKLINDFNVPAKIAGPVVGPDKTSLYLLVTMNGRLYNYDIESGAKQQIGKDFKAASGSVVKTIEEAMEKFKNDETSILVSPDSKVITLLSNNMDHVLSVNVEKGEFNLSETPEQEVDFKFTGVSRKGDVAYGYNLSQKTLRVITIPLNKVSATTTATVEVNLVRTDYTSATVIEDGSLAVVGSVSQGLILIDLLNGEEIKQNLLGTNGFSASVINLGNDSFMYLDGTGGYVLKVFKKKNSSK